VFQSKTSILGGSFNFIHIGHKVQIIYLYHFLQVTTANCDSYYKWKRIIDNWIDIRL